ncbi:MAG: 30S ribosomal protein S3 [Candidatus Heimdallarchaeota archaeon]|nr:30S ribosomal protein S3 [Candidatus Heimdallarchaeota archaeon]
MPNSIKSFTERRLTTVFLDEYFKENLGSAEYAYLDYQNTAQQSRVTIYANRVGLAIGKRGKNIKMLSAGVREILNEQNVQLEVESLEDPEKFATVMAYRLASSLERGRHFRRTAYGAIRRIMASGALGCEILISGKITSQRARVESFREGYVAKTGDVVNKYVSEGKVKAKIKRGILGIRVTIMSGDAVLPDQIDIIAEPTHTSNEITRESDLEVDDLVEDEMIEDEVDEFGELEELAEDEDLPDSATSAIEEEDLEDLEE